MAFSFGKKSRAELKGVDPRLIKVAERALALSPQDFSIVDGIRTKAEQAEYVAKGTSTTMKSKHLEGKAVDAVPYINGMNRWEWPPIYEVARAFQKAAKELGVTIRWGGCWDRNLNDIGDPERESRSYADRRRKSKQRVFLDGPHFELVG